MVFSSLLFVFVFLVLNLVIYFLVDKKYKNQVLLIFSLIFYAWGGPRFLILLVGETFISWFCGVRIQEGGNQRIRKMYMILECVLLLGLLGLFGIGTSGFAGLEVSTVFMGNLFFLIFAVISVTSLGKNVRRFLFETGKTNEAVFMIFNVLELLTPPLLLILSVLSLIGASYNPFLYFQF
ncbi:hypothetical protein B5G00_05695 [Blautia sp. An46]|nr:hypothetical protein B5G33_04950 [Blautia sp. An81]OUN93428.1 hypothetical protein B5G00_05695 [Blautia sp. An46]